MAGMKLFDSESVAAGGSATSKWIDLENLKDVAIWVKLDGSGSTSVQVDLLASPNGAFEQNAASSVSGTYTTVSLATSVGSSDMTAYDTDGLIPESAGSVALLVTEAGGSSGATVDAWLTCREVYP